MLILAVDDEVSGLNMLSRSIQKAVPDAVLSSFQSPCEALKYAADNPLNVAFVDVRMPEMDGLGLAAELKKLYPKINIIFVTGYREYAGDAFALHASGYVHKPVSPSAVREQMNNLRFMPEQPALIQALGPYTFDHMTHRVYCDGRDTLLKPREFHLFCLFANDPGVFFTPEELYQRLWGDDPNGSIHTVYVRVSALRKKLEMDGGGIYTIEQKRKKGYRLIKADE